MTGVNEKTHALLAEARYLFREMWLWTERDLALYAVVGLFLLEVYASRHKSGTRAEGWGRGSPEFALFDEHSEQPA